ncbi:zinc-binding dehydrogenase [Microbacterium sp. LWS13-1.2]|uniref:Zinc-binding dehydrogenase n=1 Tax=Microbacterium sp. LWS13-1.2 TaxID=3135264 RepID=A0AAU6SGG2_9MICO
MIQEHLAGSEDARTQVLAPRRRRWSRRRSGTARDVVEDEVEGTAVTGADLAEFARLAAAGDVRPVIDRVYPLDRIREAHAYVDSGRKRGSVIVTLADPS